MAGDLHKHCRNLLCVVYFLAALYSGQAFAADQFFAPKTGIPSLVNSDTFQGTSFDKNLTVIQFWASWCAGCAIVMADLMNIIPNKNVSYISVTLDETKASSEKFFANKSEKTKSAKAYTYWDASGASLAELNKIESLPYLLIINKQGEIIKRISGHPSKADLSVLQDR